MLRIFKYTLLALCTLCISNAFAQGGIQDPTHWTFTTKKISATEYQLIAHVTLDPKWHIWSVKPGGDGYQIPTSFTFTKNPNVTLKGSIKEEGKLITETIEGIDKPVNFFSNEVDFVQTVTVKGNTKISGKHEYQVCNDNICLPPKTQPFTFDLK